MPADSMLILWRIDYLLSKQYIQSLSGVRVETGQLALVFGGLSIHARAFVSGRDWKTCVRR
jgi:hypothetical protein